MNLILTQIKLLFKRKSFIITFTAMMAFSIFAFLKNCIVYLNSDVTSIQAAKYLFLGADFYASYYFVIFYHLMLSLIAVLPFADTYFEEGKNRITELCLVRTSNKKYYFSKLFVVFFSGFIVNFIPLLTNMLLNCIFFPADSVIDGTNFPPIYSHLFVDILKNGIFENLFAKNIYIYNIVFMLLLCLSAGLIAVIVFQFSFFYNSNRILLNCSFFAVYIISFLLLNLFKLKEFSLESYIFSGKFYCQQSIRGLVTVFSLLALTALLPTLFSKKKLNNCYD